MIRFPSISPKGEKYLPSGSSGFTLVEVIVSLLLVGIISTFSIFFLASGIEGFVLTREQADSAFNAQIALDRIRLELTDLDSLNGSPVTNASIRYLSKDAELSGDRKLWFDSGTKTLFLQVAGTDHPLINGVSSPALSVTYDDLNNDTIDEVAYIDIGFTIGTQPAYSVRIHPRTLVVKP